MSSVYEQVAVALMSFESFTTLTIPNSQQVHSVSRTYPTKVSKGLLYTRIIKWKGYRNKQLILIYLTF